MKVNNIEETVEWYKDNLKADVKYQDDTWALVSIEGFKVAFVLEEMHPPHLCFEINKEEKPELEVKYNKTFEKHRDGSEYLYVKDVSGNYIEFLYWPEIINM